MYYRSLEFVRDSARLPVQALTNEYSTLYAPPMFYVKSIQAVTVIAAVGIFLLGRFKFNISEIAAERRFLDIIVKACTDKRALSRTN